MQFHFSLCSKGCIALTIMQYYDSLDGWKNIIQLFCLKKYNVDADFNFIVGHRIASQAIKFHSDIKLILQTKFKFYIKDGPIICECTSICENPLGLYTLLFFDRSGHHGTHTPTQL